MKKYGRWVLWPLTAVLMGSLVAGAAAAHLERGYHFGHAQSPHWQGHKHHGWGFGHSLDRMQETVGLSDEQTEKIWTIVTEARKKGVMSWADLRVAKLDLRQLLAQTDADQGKVEEHVNRIGQLRQQLLRHRIGTFFEIRDVLTPDQRKKARPFLLKRALSGRPGRFH